MSIIFRVTPFLLILLFLSQEHIVARASHHASGSLRNGTTSDEDEVMVPIMGKGSKIERMGKMLMVLNQSELFSRRKLNSFQICALCTCCGGARGVCLPSPCCYAINCHIPNRPFGFCSFTPKTCNCFGCHL